MEAIYFGNIKVWGYGTGNGPWIMADMENGLYSGVNAGYNANDPTIGDRFTTAMIEGGPNQWAILGGNAQSGGLSTFYSGARPNVSGYNPMHKEGAIILGIGGDNSKGSAGTFYEGVMTSGYPSAATESAVQANITSAGYATFSGGTGATGPIVAGVNSAKCVDNNNGSGTAGNKVQIWDCDGNTAAQNWTVNSNGTLTIDGGCMDITNANYSNGTLIEWWSCNGGANQQWQASGGDSSTRPPANAWTTQPPTPPTGPSSSCTPATAAPTSTGSCPDLTRPPGTPVASRCSRAAAGHRPGPG